MRQIKYDIRTGVKKIKTKTALAISGATLGFAGMIMAVAMPLGAKAASDVVVTPSNLNGWVKTEANTGLGANGTINFVPSTGAYGTGAAEFSTPDSGSYTRLRKAYNTKLSDITSLSYNTKQISGTANTADVNLRLYICTSAPTPCADNFDDVLVFEPYYNNVSQQPIQTNTWQTWNGLTGFWWSNSGLTYNTHVPVPGSAGGYDTNFHLSDVLVSFPNANIVSIGLGTGDFNSPWVVQADKLVVNDTTYNFEPNQNGTDKDACKNNGWKTMNDGTKSFKNQGDCVSWFATGGRNVAAGATAHFATGNVAITSPAQTLSFTANDNGISAADTGTVTYSNLGASLTYTANLTCVKVTGQTAYFAYVIPPGSPYTGTWVVWKVVDGGLSADTAGFSTAGSISTANALCETGFTTPDYSATTATGNILVQ